MYKRILLLLAFLTPFMSQAEQTDSFFGYNKELLVDQYKNVQNTIRKHKIKKLAFYGGTAALLTAVFAFKLLKHSSDTNVLTYEEMHDCIEKMEAEKGKIGWGKWLWNGAKWMTGESVIRGTSGFFIGKYMGTMNTRTSFVTLGWYVENHTGDLIKLLKELENDSDLLPLEEDHQERIYKATLYKEKLKMLVPHIAGIIAYMTYAKHQVEKESIAEAIRMEYVLNHLKDSFYVFCKKTENLVNHYESETDAQQAMVVGVEIPTAFSTFTSHFYSDIKAFERYEVLGIED